MSLPKDIIELIYEYAEELKAYERLMQLNVTRKYCDVMEELKYAHTFGSNWADDFPETTVPVLSNIANYTTAPYDQHEDRYRYEPWDHWKMIKLFFTKL